MGPRCITTPGPLFSVQRDEGLCSPVLSSRRRSYHNRGRVSQTTPLCVCVDNFFAAAPKPLPYWAYRRPAPCQIKQFLRLRRRLASPRRDVLRANHPSDVGVRKASAYGSWADGAFPKHELPSLSASSSLLGIAMGCRHASCRQAHHCLFAPSWPLAPCSRSCCFGWQWPLQG